MFPFTEGAVCTVCQRLCRIVCTRSTKSAPPPTPHPRTPFSQSVSQSVRRVKLLSMSWFEMCGACRSSKPGLGCSRAQLWSQRPRGLQVTPWEEWAPPELPCRLAGLRSVGAEKTMVKWSGQSEIRIRVWDSSLGRSVMQCPGLIWSCCLHLAVSAVSYLRVRAVVCVQAVSLRLRLYLTRLLCGGGGAGSAAGCDWSPLAAWGPCGAHGWGHHTGTAQKLERHII